MKLWHKGKTLAPPVERFTVGNDYLLDVRLLPFECMASAAHAMALEKASVLTGAEREKLVEALRDLSERGITITREEEDIHTAVEHYLVERLGDLGKKIHTGRSRNDQVMVDLQLWIRHGLEHIHGLVMDLCGRINEFSRTHAALMPGYTHMQRAMPSSLQLLLGSYLESLIDDAVLVRTSYGLNNSSPLGSAAGYGTSLPLDREYTAALLGFRGIRNCIYVQARSKHMAAALFPLTSIMTTLERIASDLMLFTMGEFAFFALPEELCTGSSIMPQKKNYDLLELMRARASMVHGHSHAIAMTGMNLISGYNRDYQITKGPLMEAFDMTDDSLEIAALVFDSLIVNEECMKRAITPEFFATDRAYELVSEGHPFRTAYAEVAAHLEDLKVPSDMAKGRDFLLFRDYSGEVSREQSLFKDQCAMAKVW